MTPEQKAALEQVSGITLSDTLVALLDPLLDPENRNDVQITAVLNAEITLLEKMRLKNYAVGVGTILSELAPTGGDFLDALEAAAAADSNVKWSMYLIKAGTFDVGMPASRVQMTALGAADPSLTDGMTKLLALGEELAILNFNSVSDVLNVAEGRMTL